MRSKSNSQTGSTPTKPCVGYAQLLKTLCLARDLDIDQFVWELFSIYLSHHLASRFLKAKDADKRAQKAFAALITRSGAEELPKREPPAQPKSKKEKHE